MTAKEISEDWQISDKLRQQCIKICPEIDLDAEREQFIDYWQSTNKNYEKRSWDATFRNRIRSCKQNVWGIRLAPILVKCQSLANSLGLKLKDGWQENPDNTLAWLRRAESDPKVVPMRIKK